jgi:hypothetical protein
MISRNGRSVISLAREMSMAYRTTGYNGRPHSLVSKYEIGKARALVARFERATSHPSLNFRFSDLLMPKLQRFYR